MTSWTKVGGKEQVALEDEFDYEFNLYEPGLFGRAKWELLRFAPTGDRTAHVTVVASGVCKRERGSRWISIGGFGYKARLAKGADAERQELLRAIHSA